MENTTKRKNFHCIFNRYVSEANRDAVVKSVISQFEGYYAEPEVTLTDDGFTLTITLGSNLSVTQARDKILWNHFIDRVTAKDAIRKIQIIRVPKTQAGLMDFGRRPGEGSVGGFGPEVDPIVGDTGVDEKLRVPLTNPPKYKIDGGQNPRTLGETASIHYADPGTDAISEGQSFVKGLTPADLSSRVNDMHENDNERTELEGAKPKPKVLALGSFRRIAIDSDTGGGLTPRTFNQYNSDINDVHTLQKTNQGEAMMPRGNFFNTVIENERGSRTGVESEKRGDEASAAPLIITTSKEPEVEDVDSAVQLPQARGGGQAVPDGGQVEGFYSSALPFGLQEGYYNEDYDINEFDV